MRDQESKKVCKPHPATNVHQHRARTCCSHLHLSRLSYASELANEGSSRLLA